MGICYRPITACSTSPCLDCRSGYCMHYGYCEWERLPPSPSYSPDVGYEQSIRADERQKLIAAGWISPTELAKEKFKAGCEGRQEGESAMVAKFQGWESPEQVQWFKDEILELQLEIRDYREKEYQTLNQMGGK